MSEISDSIFLVDYNSDWPRMAELEITYLKKILGEIDATYEHIGSTSIPNIIAKPIIDIMVGVTSLEDARATIDKLEAISYSYWRDNPFKEHFFFVKGLPLTGGSGRTHHVHVIEKNSPFWIDQLLFRDYLRGNRSALKAYEDLKRNIAVTFKHDRDGYTEAKTEFVRSILTNARLGS